MQRPPRYWRWVALTLIGAVAIAFGGVTEDPDERPAALRVAHAQVGGCSAGAQTQVAFLGQVVTANAVVWCVDRSGSMVGANLALVKQAIIDAIQLMHPQQSFGVVAFSSSFSAFQPALVHATPANKAGVTAWIQGLTADGLSCMAPAGVQAVELANAHSLPQRRIWIVSDGVPNCPGAAETITAITAANFQHIPIDTFLIGGNSGGLQFMEQLAVANGGEVFQAP